jgi:hypothetical protein
MIVVICWVISALINVGSRLGLILPINADDPFTIIFKYVLPNLQGFFSSIAFLYSSDDIALPFHDLLNPIRTISNQSHLPPLPPLNSQNTPASKVSTNSRTDGGESGSTTQVSSFSDSRNQKNTSWKNSEYEPHPSCIEMNASLHMSSSFDSNPLGGWEDLSGVLKEANFSILEENQTINPIF